MPRRPVTMESHEDFDCWEFDDGNNAKVVQRLQNEAARVVLCEMAEQCTAEIDHDASLDYVQVTFRPFGDNSDVSARFDLRALIKDRIAEGREMGDPPERTAALKGLLAAVEKLAQT